jgi:hypothetical protein
MSTSVEIFPIVPATSRFLWIVLPTVLALLGVIALMISLLYSPRHLRVELSPDSLRIRGDVYGRTIPVSALDVDQAEMIRLRESPYAPSWRMNGVGLPGYLSGWFKLRSKERGLLFVTDQEHVVRIPTRKGYTLLLSVAEPERFLERLRAMPR